MEDSAFQAIAVVHSPFHERFGIPRQPRLIEAAKGTVELLPPYNVPDAVRELDSFSHIWLVFRFHSLDGQGWSPTVRPPRLGGNLRVGVFASRSPFRPNPIGLSVLRLDSVTCTEGAVTLEVSGLDLLDGTPVLDIKPYVPYVDAVTDARGGFAPHSPERVLDVSWLRQAREQLHQLVEDRSDRIAELIVGMIALDPRPGYQRNSETRQTCHMAVAGVDVSWEAKGNQATVTAVRAPTPDRRQPPDS